MVLQVPRYTLPWGATMKLAVFWLVTWMLRFTGVVPCRLVSAGAGGGTGGGLGGGGGGLGMTMAATETPEQDSRPWAAHSCLMVTSTDALPVFCQPLR